MSIRDGALIAKRCPQCGRLLARDSLRCGYCLTEVWDVEADTELDATTQAVPTRNPAFERARSGLARIWALPKWLLLLALVLLAVAGWRVSASLQPERVLPLPASAARSLPASSAVWGAIHGDATHTRRTDVTVPLDAADQAWQTDLGVPVEGSPVADEARVYVATTNNSLVALHNTDGSVAWIYEVSVPMSDTPIVAGGRVFLLTRGGAAISLDAATGMEVWQTALPSHFFNAPTLVDGVLYAFGTTKELYGLDSEDGHLLWTIGTGSDWATLPPLVAGEWIAVATDDSVDLYDRKSGELTLEHPHSRAVSLTFHNGYVVSASAGFISRIDPRDELPWWWDARGAWLQLWVWGLAPEPPRAGLDWLTTFPQPTRFGVPRPDVYAPAFSDDTIVVADELGLVRALDSGSGTERWAIDVGEVTGAPVWTPEGVLLPLHDALSLRAPEDGAEIARRTLPAASNRSMVVTDAGVFLASNDGRISALTW